MFLSVLLHLLLPLTSAIPIARRPRAVTVTHIVDGNPLACTSGNIGIDPSIPQGYVNQFCSIVSASQPDWLIKVTGLSQGNVNILYAWEAAGKDYSQTCSTKCVQAFTDIIQTCKYFCDARGSACHTYCCDQVNTIAMTSTGWVHTPKVADNSFSKSPPVDSALFAKLSLKMKSPSPA
jgi:hypothetical protein